MNKGMNHEIERLEKENLKLSTERAKMGIAGMFLIGLLVSCFVWSLSLYARRSENLPYGAPNACCGCQDSCELQPDDGGDKVRKGWQDG